MSLRQLIALTVILSANVLSADELSVSDKEFDFALRKAGPPLRDASGVLFRFSNLDDEEVEAVYLAGSFNSWANNDDGVVNNPRFLMRQAPSGVRYAFIDTPSPTFEYQFVLRTKNGEMIWMPDPSVDARSGNNSVLSLSDLDPLRTESTQVVASTRKDRLALSLDRVWVEPSVANTLNVDVGSRLTNLGLTVRVLTALGEQVYRGSILAQNGLNQILLPPMEATGGYIVEVELVGSGRSLATETIILSVTDRPADDLRYGFFASYPDDSKDYDAKATMLADLYVNAVEFYDYFPAHGKYAPNQSQYSFEPFGVPINGLDVKAKIEACQRKGILALAYISAYAASESIYRQITDPMTDADGRPKVFNGEIMAEEDADKRGKPKWFWLMNISEGAEWRTYIMDELRRTLEENHDDLVAFDGFEIDTYGDPADARFYAKNSRLSEEPLAEVLQGFVSDVVSMTREVKPHGLVSFNSVNEFGVQNMYEVTDFLFLEIWRWQAKRLSDLVDICYFHHGASNQRVILKLYPADMEPAHKSWPKWTLARVLGATMTGGGSLMVAGEPDEASSTMHALNSLYYPDHQAMSAANTDLLRRYYKHDAMLYEYSHGDGVKNLDLRVPVEGSITRAFHAPEKNAMCLQLLRVGDRPDWSDAPASISPAHNLEVSFNLPDDVSVKEVFYATPDTPAYHSPTRIEFAEVSGRISFTIPELIVHGSIIAVYERQ
ncbi:MAG: glycoside hydrolase family 66 protein [Verrucomicrobiota bacterium]